MEGHSSYVAAVSWSLDGGRLASGSYDKTVRVWNAETGAAMLTIEGHWSYVTAVTWSPDGGRLASGSGDNTVRAWATNTAWFLPTPICMLGFTAGPREAILTCFLANYWLYEHDRTSLPDEVWCLILGFLRGLDLGCN